MLMDEWNKSFNQAVNLIMLTKITKHNVKKNIKRGCYMKKRIIKKKLKQIRYNRHLRALPDYDYNIDYYFPKLHWDKCLTKVARWNDSQISRINHIITTGIKKNIDTFAYNLYKEHSK